MPANQLTLKDLKSELWRCAEILRGSAVDRTDWKGYILPLLFFKRISDVWDEEAAEARKIFGETDLADFPELHRFTLPDGCHWQAVRETPSNVGAVLARAMRAIERANPETLTRVFGAADWGNREMLGDELLRDLIEGLSSVPLGNEAVESDVLGDAYEYLIGKFADITRRKKAGEFYTPRSVVRMMVELLDPQEGESIYDPACGTGGMLLGAIEHVERAGGDPRTFFGRIFGEEKNLTTSSIARMNLVLHGVEDFRIEQNDTLRDPAFTDTSGALATFDCVIANPPFSLKEWGREVWEADPWGRAAFGLPPAELRRLRLGPADGGVDGGRLGPDGGGAAAGRAVPQGRGGPYPAGTTGAGSDRGGDRARAQHLLRHGSRPGGGDAAPREATRSTAEGDRDRRVEPVPQGPGAELPRPGAC